MASYYKFALKAGQAIQVPIAGKVILVDDLGGAPGLDITPVYQGQNGITMPNRQTAFKVWVDYDAVTLAAPVDCTVALFLSQTDVSLGFTNGSSINVQGAVTVSNGAGARIPVDVGGSNITVNTANITVNNDDAHPVPTKAIKASIVTDSAPVNVNQNATAILAANATRRNARIRNLGPDPVALVGSNATTYANAAVLLQAGETWSEDDAPGAAWYAICDAGNTAVLNLQEIKQ